MDWGGLKADDSLLQFVRGLSALRRARPELRRDTFLKGALQASHSRDISWWHPAGHEMADQEWNDPGPALPRRRARRHGVRAGPVAAAESHRSGMRVPAAVADCQRHWDVVLDTAHPVGVLSGFRLPAGPVKVGPYQTLALQRVR